MWGGSICTYLVLRGKGIPEVWRTRDTQVILQMGKSSAQISYQSPAHDKHGPSSLWREASFLWLGVKCELQSPREANNLLNIAQLWAELRLKAAGTLCPWFVVWLGPGHLDGLNGLSVSRQTAPRAMPSAQ